MTQFAIYPSLKGRGVLVTGGASGIGAATAGHFLAQGSRVGSMDFDAVAAKKLLASLGEVALRSRFVPAGRT